MHRQNTPSIPWGAQEVGFWTDFSPVPRGHHPSIMGQGPHAQVCRTAGAQKHPRTVTGLHATVLRTPWNPSGSKGQTIHFREDDSSKAGSWTPTKQYCLGGEWQATAVSRDILDSQERAVRSLTALAPHLGQSHLLCWWNSWNQNPSTLGPNPG